MIATNIGLSHLGQIFITVQNIALDPVKNTIYYLVPYFGAMSSKYTPIAPQDSSTQSIMSDASKGRILAEIERLRQSANLARKINTYTALNLFPMSYELPLADPSDRSNPI